MLCLKRSIEHKRDWKNRKEDHPLTKHWQEMHQEDETEPEFSMNIVRTFKKALERQIAEAVMIGNNEFDYILNSKSEWNSQAIPRLVTEIRDKTAGEDHQGKQQKRRKLGNQPPGRNGPQRQAKRLETKESIMNDEICSNQAEGREMRDQPVERKGMVSQPAGRSRVGVQPAGRTRLPSTNDQYKQGGIRRWLTASRKCNKGGEGEEE